MRTKHRWTTALGATALCAAALQLNPGEVTAADHGDAPLTMMDAAIDIADYYAWHTDRGTIVAVITYAPGIAPGGDPVYDDGVLYTIHIDNTASVAENADIFDNDNDNASDIQIQVRFGQNNAGEWGVQFNNVPGAENETFDGEVNGDPLTDGTVTAWAGLRDDPFFFDLDGFGATAANLVDDTDPADLAFSGLVGEAVDTLAGQNVMAIVVEFDAALAADGNADNFIQTWATTGVLPK